MHLVLELALRVVLALIQLAGERLQLVLVLAVLAGDLGEGPRALEEVLDEGLLLDVCVGTQLDPVLFLQFLAQKKHFDALRLVQLPLEFLVLAVVVGFHLQSSRLFLLFLRHQGWLIEHVLLGAAVCRVDVFDFLEGALRGVVEHAGHLVVQLLILALILDHFL